MFAFELTTRTPCGSAPYYSLVIRDPYILGSHPAADIAISHDGVAPQHLSLTVLHAQEAEREVAAATRGQRATAPRSEDSAGGAAAAAGDYEDEEDGDAVRAPASSGDRLVVRVTALPTKGDGEVRIGNVTLQPGDSVIARDGDVLYLDGEEIRGTFHYRPLMVGLETGSYPEDYVRDLRRMFDQLGATFVDEPVPASELPHVPIGQLYCAEEVNDSTSCLAAMSYGYSIVQPTYVFEFFAAVSRKASAPLSTLPSPTRFEVPVRCTTHPTTTTYLRPESDTCPFSLFPIPATAITNRSRADLFAGRVFFFFTDAAATRYWRAVEDCGGAVYGPGDVDAAREAIRRLVDAQHESGASSHRLPNNFYIIIDNTSEAVLLNSGLEAASPELLAFMTEAESAYGAADLCVMGDHSLFTSLLSNRFCEEPVALTAGVPVAAAATSQHYTDAAESMSMPLLGAAAAGDHEGGYHGGVDSNSARSPRSTYSPRYHSGGNNNNSSGPVTSARSASRLTPREQNRRNSLLPRTTDRTPSRSQLRSFSRQRARSLSMQSGNGAAEAPSVYEESSYRAASASGRHGRRHLVPSVIEGEMRSFAEDFDMVRVRIYAFLVREEPKLDKAIATYHRNLYVTTESMEYALEIKAQAEDFMERVDDLLADPACHGAYTESLRRFWRDCSDMDVKAQHLLHCWDRRFPAAALPRRSLSRRASSASGRRAPSSRSVTPRGPPSLANATLPAGHGETTAAAQASVHTPRRRDADGTREHRELYMSHEAAQRLQAADAGEEGAEGGHHAATPQEVAAATGAAPTHAYDHHHHQQQHNGAQAEAGRAPGYAASSRRRSITPRAKKSSRASSARHGASTGQRPPWVSTWGEDAGQQQYKKQQQQKQQKPSRAAAKTAPTPTADSESSSYPTPARQPQEHKTPRSVQRAPEGEVAKYAPANVRARSTGRGVGGAAAASSAKRSVEVSPPPPHQQRRPQPQDVAVSDGSIRFSVVGEEESMSPVTFAEEPTQPHHQQQQQHTQHRYDDHDDSHDVTEGTVNYAVEEEQEPATHAADLAHTESGDDEADETEVRSVPPVPTPQQQTTSAPASSAKAASAKKPRSPSASMTKRASATKAPAQNGSANAAPKSATNGHGRRKSSTSTPSAEKPRAVRAWRY